VTVVIFLLVAERAQSFLCLSSRNKRNGYAGNETLAFYRDSASVKDVSRE